MLNLIAEKVTTLKNNSKQFTDFSEFVSHFHQSWMEIGRELQEHLIQERIEQVESEQVGCRQIRTRNYHTPMGTIELKRRVYERAHGYECLADQVLCLPGDAWSPVVLELASALGVSQEFASAQQLLKRWTGIAVTPRTIANQVEAAGNRLQEVELAQPPQAIAPLDSMLVQAVVAPQAKPRVYVGVDGVMTPLNQAQGYKEARVGVVFKEMDHWRTSPKRAQIRVRHYVATLHSREHFQERVYQLYTQVVGQRAYETVVLGDGAPWIWQMAEQYFPNCIQILDFFHVSEYVWAVARSAYPQQDVQQKTWVEQQQSLLKQSQWRAVVSHLQHLAGSSCELRQAKVNLERYLTNNQTRIDYQRYLAAGLMIGSGVVESSNRRVVTQRLKQAGMHWSKPGAEGVMALRAAYLSDSERWQKFWYPLAA